MQVHKNGKYPDRTLDKYSNKYYYNSTTSTQTSTKRIVEVYLCSLGSGIWLWDSAGRCGCRAGIPARMSRAVSLPGGVWAAVRSFLLPTADCVRDAEERSDVMMNRRSPCLTCKRVEEPENCTDKSCRAWQAWFLQQWEQTRLGLRRLKDMPQCGAGVAVGGRRYAAPHQVRAYLRRDPCGECRCPAQLCETPCRRRLVWEDCIREDG